MTDQRFIILAPTFNNVRTLPAVLCALGQLQFPIIVIDDGCTDATASLLAGWNVDQADRFVVVHETNLGKAAALRSGFDRASKLGFTHAITIDTDGQHDAADIASLIAAATLHPQSLILGTRVARAQPAGMVASATMSTRHAQASHRVPFRSTIGRRISNHFVWLESGAIVADSQCGLRIYPLEIERRLASRTSRYGFETEVLTRFAWCGASIVQVPIRCIYEVEGGRTTHFRVVRDSLAAIVMHAKLVNRSLLPWPVPKLIVSQPPTGFGTISERLAHWMNPLRVWREVRASQSNRKRFATAMASGVALAALPPYGMKTITCLLISKKFKLDSAVMIAASSLNTPPVGPVLAAAGIFVGHTIRFGAIPSWSSYDPAHIGFRTMLCAVGLDWLVGSLIVAATLATVVYIVARYSLSALAIDAEALTPLSVVGERRLSTNRATSDAGAAHELM